LGPCVRTLGRPPSIFSNSGNHSLVPN
jgi:hypothetical protein